ncbi:MAG: DUF2339 domain-containing protein [Lachnospiraceae bacterium]|nr:DUF2339 domain-containing protein [Lachnospiraceae bacterium]
MNQKETDLLNFENELLNTRKKLNDLIYKCANEQPDSENRALYQEKIIHLEKELTYLNRQFQLLKQSQYNTFQPQAAQMQTPNMPRPGYVETDARRQPVVQPVYPQPGSTYSQPYGQPVNAPAWKQAAKQAEQKDYEKLFGKNFMGIFASVLIFISLIIFATLLLPHLTDTMKLIGLYIISFGLIVAGFVLIHKNKNNKFYIALIGCGVGSLYITLLLSDLYFKVIGDILLYTFILIWAVFVRYLTRLKSLIFHIIGQLGIFISSILGVLLCVHDADAQKLLVLTVFYFIAAFVFAFKSKRSDNADSDETKTDGLITYEQNICIHLFKSLNLIVFMLGFFFMDPSTLRTVNISIIMVYMLGEFYFSFKEKCAHGLAFQILTVVNSIVFILLFHAMNILAEEHSFAFMYLVSVAVLFYVNLKDAEYRIVSEICCSILICLGCYNHSLISKHLFAYLTVIPFMLYGKWKGKKLYLYTGLAYLAGFFFVLEKAPLVRSSSAYFLKMEYLIMLIAIYGVFLYICRTTGLTTFKVIGYLILCLLTVISVRDTAITFLSAPLHGCATGFPTVDSIPTKASLITFFTLAVIHLILNKLEYFGKEKPVEVMMYAVNGFLMIAGCIALYKTIWQIPVILITILLFMINSKKLFQKNTYAGYYIMLKYTILMFCILNSYDVINYLISICLLLFAIISIVIGFYKDTKSFRLYGLLLSMVSIFKLIMIDIQYDSTMENAVSFFVSGVLCFIISFIYNRIDHNFQKRE